MLNLSKKLLNDWDEFNRVVKQNVNILTSRLCSGVGTNYADSVAGLAVFRNSGAEIDESGSSRYMWDAMWNYCKIGDRVLRSDYLRIPSFKEFPYSSQPFANADTLELALEQVKRVFNPRSPFHLDHKITRFKRERDRPALFCRLARTHHKRTAGSSGCDQKRYV